MKLSSKSLKLNTVLLTTKIEKENNPILYFLVNVYIESFDRLIMTELT